MAPPEAQFPFSVECKAYATVNLYLALYGKCEVFDWWEQCRCDSDRVKRIPMLICKQNNRKPLIVLSKKLWDNVSPRLKLDDVPVMTLTYKVKTVRRSIVLLAFHEFLRVCPARLLKPKERK